MHSGALRAAGWPDERPVGSGSCPCQGFSLAGKGLGFDDPRHLFPDWLRLIDEAGQQGQPWTETLFIEQVASAGAWLDLVQSSLEARGYAFDATDLPAAGFAQGAHIRQRFYGVADRHNAERWADLAGGHFGDWPQAGRIEGYGEPRASGPTSQLVDTHGRDAGAEHADVGRLAAGDHAQGIAAGFDPGGADGGMGHVAGHRWLETGCNTACNLSTDRTRATNRAGHGSTDVGMGDHHHQGSPLGSRNPDERGAIRVEGPTVGQTGSLLGCDWLLCHDARIRPVEPGTFPLAASYSGRVGALRIFGNGLDFEAATQFVAAFLEAEQMAEMLSCL